MTEFGPIRRGNNGKVYPTIPTVTYSLLIPVEHFEVLRQRAHDRSKVEGYTSIAELIREAIADYVKKHNHGTGRS